MVSSAKAAGMSRLSMKRAICHAPVEFFFQSWR